MNEKSNRWVDGWMDGLIDAFDDSIINMDTYSNYLIDK